MLRLEEEDIYAGIATSGSGGGDTPESAKGSFNASTQQLTLKYDYLVEMINSSTMITDEQKTAQIASLNNSNIVINMASEAETMPENDYVYGFVLTVGDTGVGECYVDKQTPVTLKLAVTPESLGIIGSYEALAGFFTQITGQPTSPEMVEAQYGQFIVDENLCTVSGTLGNFEVKFIEDKPVVEKYGATISNFLGDVDSNGVLQAPSGEADVVFTGVKDLADNALYSRFSSQTNKGKTPVKSISFPDLENISGSGAIQNICYYNSYLNSISFPKLKTVTGTYAANNAFNHCDNLTGAVNFPELTSVSGTGIQSGQMGGMFAVTKITSISFPKLTTIGSSSTSTGANMSSICSQCKNLAQISFPSLEKIGDSGLSYSFSGCSALTSVIFPSLTNIFNNGLVSAFQNCTSLTSISFPSLVSNFNYWGGSSWSRDYSWQNMLKGVTGCTVHFPSNLQAVIGSDTAVTAGFGGTNTTVLFDLPATE